MDFEVENRGKCVKNRFENSRVVGCCFSRDFRWIWEGFGEGFGGLVGNFSRLFSNILRHVNDFGEKLDFGGSSDEFVQTCVSFHLF